MLVPVQPVYPEPGVPPAPMIDEATGLGSWTQWIQDTVKTTLDKIEVPGFGAPTVGKVTTVGPGGSTTVYQAENYPVTAPQASVKTGIDISAGAGVMLAGAAVLIALVVISGKGSKK